MITIQPVLLILAVSWLLCLAISATEPVNRDEHMYLAAASFNFHGAAFTFPFNIRVRNVKNTLSGCIGYGLERWILSFLSQYGEDISAWPEEIRTYVKDRR